MKRLFNYIAIAVLLVALFSCKGGQKAPQTPPTDFAAYVSAFTGGIVTDDASVRVDLVQEVPESQRITEGLFALSPSVKGSVLWTSPNSVSFFPDDGALEVGKTYSVTFHLGKVLPAVDEKMKDFNFGFTVGGESVKGAEKANPESKEEKGFRVVSAVNNPGNSPYVELLFSSEPVNATVKGMIEMEGVSNYYTELREGTVLVHYEGARDKVSLKVSSGVKDALGNALGSDFVREFVKDEEAPAVHLLSHGSILPESGNLILPFRAVNLSAVEVRIVKIYASNVLMFLQDNDLGENSSLRRAGRLVFHSDIPLDRSKDLHRWNNFSIDLSKLLHSEPGAIYSVRLSFRQDQSLYGGKDPGPSMVSSSFGKPSAEDEKVWDKANAYYWDNDYDWENYDYNEKDDPTKPSYYMDSDRFPYVQILPSDLGLIAKYAGSDELWVGANDLVSAKPVDGVQLDVYDFQLQKIASARTGSDGMVGIKVGRRPFVVVGTWGKSITYLKVSDGNEISLSRYDVGGETINKGLKACIYGERGVWRPGDTIHLTAIVDSKDGSLPDGHPATLEVYTPEGKFFSRHLGQSLGGFYSFDIPTSADAPTGFWDAYLKVGGSSFYKTLNVETIKPNRLKIDADYGSSPLIAGSVKKIKIASSWLTGSPASGLKAGGRMTLRYGTTTFKGFEKYRFTPPQTGFRTSESDLFKTTLSPSGEAEVSFTVPSASNAPGMLRATIVTSVEEEGGDESFVTSTVPFSPYSAYVGIKVPEGDYLETDKTHKFNIAVVDPDGKRISGHKLEYRIFKTGWYWWWESGVSSIDSYVSGSSVRKISEGTLVSQSSDVQCQLKVDYPEWGRYVIVVRDSESGHVSGAAFTVDWPEYRGRADRRDPENLTMLTFSTDKPSYRVGEKATVYIPAAPGGQALVSLENASGVISSSWVSAGSEDRPWSFTVTEEMAPNFYVHLTLVQPYGNVSNDLPLRLYGVQRVLVENPQSHLDPQISMPSAIHPEEEFSVTVSEKSGRPMTYTLAIVDEGLLDITAFKTPDPWKAMNSVEALGVRTWDMYDEVMGAAAGRFSTIAAIGGDQDNIVSARKDNRFNPVVWYLKPQTLGKGGKAVHKVTLPMYVGSVRVMLIAAGENAFGSAEKTVPVTAPLMVLSSLPRRVAPGEEFTLPVNVFATEKGVKEAVVSVKAGGPLKLVGESKGTASFKNGSDDIVRFALKAESEGTATIEVKASGAGHSASETLTLEVVNPNPIRTIVTRTELSSGKGTTHKAEGEKSYVQLSSFPSFDALSLYKDMVSYPYDCTEQLAARGLAILHLLPMLNEGEAAGAGTVIDGIIKMLYSRQNSDGGFSLWGRSASDSWVSSMAGQFLTEASGAGYKVDGGVLSAWKRYQQKLSGAYRIAGSSVLSHMDEAYRLYSLAVAGAPSTSAMNRLREEGNIGYRASWMLASAYALSGKSKVAETIISSVGRDFEDYDSYNMTYGTSFRDRMVALEALALTGNLAEAVPIAANAAEKKSFSTQEAAFAAIAFDRLRSLTGPSGIDASVSGEAVKVSSSSVSVPVKGEVKVVNNAEGKLFAAFTDLIRDPAGTAVPAWSSSLELSVRYLGSDGRPVNVKSLHQGDTFFAEATVTNPSKVSPKHNLVLSMPIPSGWEILNDRLTGGVDEGYDHTDIRDDRCNWFFDLESGKSRRFTLKLRAAYEGTYFLPSVSCNAMYDREITAGTASSTVSVVR